MPSRRAGHTSSSSERLRAVALLARGLSQADVARKLGVTREAIRKWKASYALEGFDALARVSRPREPRVSLAKIEALIDRMAMNPARHGLGRHWTAEDARRLIEDKLGVSYTLRYVHKLLGRLGYRFLGGVGFRKIAEAPERPSEAPWGFARRPSGDLARDEREQAVLCVVRLMHVSGFTMPEIVDVLRDADVRDRRDNPAGVRLVFEMIHGGRTSREASHGPRRRPPPVDRARARRGGRPPEHGWKAFGAERDVVVSWLSESFVRGGPVKPCPVKPCPVKLAHRRAERSSRRSAQ